MVEPHPSWARVHLGEEFGPIEYRVTADTVREYADQVDDHHPWYLEDSPFGGPIAHPAITAGDYVRLANSKGYAFIGTVHISAEHQYLNPVRPGKTLIAKGRTADLYRKRGRDYMVMESVTCDEDGVELVRSRNTWLLSMKRYED